MKVLLLIKFERKTGQLCWVKFVPKPPSNGFGRGEFADDAVDEPLLPESVDVADAVSVADAAAALELAPVSFWAADVVALALPELDEEPESVCRL